MPPAGSRCLCTSVCCQFPSCCPLPVVSPHFLQCPLWLSPLGRPDDPLVSRGTPVWRNFPSGCALITWLCHSPVPLPGEWWTWVGEGVFLSHLFLSDLLSCRLIHSQPRLPEVICFQGHLFTSMTLVNSHCQAVQLLSVCQL